MVVFHACGLLLISLSFLRCSLQGISSKMKVLFLICQLLKRLPRNLNDASLLGTLPHSQPNGTLGYISLVRSTMSHKMVKRSSPKFFRSLTYSFNYLFMLFSQYWRIFSVQSIDSGATSNSKNHSDPRETHHI